MRIVCHHADFARMTNWKNDQAPCITTMAGSLLGAQSNHHDAEVHPPFSLACAREHQPRPMLAAYRVVLHFPRHGRSWSALGPLLRKMSLFDTECFFCTLVFC